MTQDNASNPVAADTQPVPPGGDPHDGDGPPRSRKRWVLAAMAALAVALFAVPLLRGPGPQLQGSAGSSGALPPGTAACTASEGAANFDFKMKDMNGAEVNLADYKGKVVLLNFWATWCAPCRVEIPEFVEVYDHYRDQGFEILGVLAQDEPSQEDFRSFASQFKMNYPLLRANEEFENAHGPIWALPTTYIIDRHGSICSKHMGPVTKDTVEREIKALL
jgi:cytochrome c biogenesis protein CcmG/thiol:disulfide interchange protein DsbE